MKKTCTKCKSEKPLMLFVKASRNKDGHSSVCKECHSGSYYDKKGRYTVEPETKRLRKNEQAKVYKAENQDKIKADRVAYQPIKVANERKRYKSDPLFNLKSRLRGRIQRYFQQGRFVKEKTSAEYLGADFSIVKLHIERQFKKGMTWKNRGLWHVDHKIPLASAKNESELKVLLHYTNLQPLWAVENMSKSDKILPMQTVLTI